MDINRFKDRVMLTVVSVALLLVSAIVTQLISWSPWLLLIPILLLLAIKPICAFKRWLALRWNGFFVRSTREYRAIYEERSGNEIRSIPLHTENFEPGRDHVVIPTRSEWNNLAPEWAKNRRDEIFQRVIKNWHKGWVWLPTDWET